MENIKELISNEKYNVELKEDVSLFDKVRAFFKGLFSKKDKKVKEEVHVINNHTKEEKQVNEKVSNVTDNRKKEYITFIEKNPNEIDNLTDDKLDKLIRYYRRIIALKKIRLNKLKENKN